MRYQFLIVCSLICLFCQGQNSPDSLQTVLNKSKTDSVSIHRLLKQAEEMPSSKSELQKIIAVWAIEQSRKNNFPFLISLSHYTAGRIYLEEGNHTVATDHFGQCLLYASRYHLFQHEVNAYNALANIYKRNKQYDKAIFYYKQSIAVCHLHQYEKGLMYASYNLGALLYEASDKRPFLHTSEPIAWINRSIEIAEKFSENDFVMQASGVVARLYAEENKYDSAIYSLNKAEKLIRHTGKEEYLTNHFYSLGIFYLARKDYKAAVDAFEKGVVYSKKFRKPVFEYRFYNNLSTAYDSLGEISNAYRYKKLYFQLYDSLSSKEKLSIISDAENKYQKAIKDIEIERLKADQIIKKLEIEKKEALIAGNLLEAKRKEDQIKLLSQESALHQLQLARQSALISKKNWQAKADSQQIVLKNQQALLNEKQISNQKKAKNILIAGIIGLSLLAFLFYRNIQSKKKAYVQLEKKSLQIKEQALQLSKQARQIAQFQSQMNPHFVYNALHNIQGLVLTDQKQKANTQIQSLAQLMRKTFANAEKDDIPVEEEINYLHKYIDFEKAAFGNNLNFEVNVTREAEGALIPPMMIQPFIENAIKHAELKKVQNPYIRVLIETENNLLSINIKDNGTGIKKEISGIDKLSHSMSVIQSRLDLIFKGRADVNNQPVFSIKTIPEIQEGTSIKFYLPLNFGY